MRRLSFHRKEARNDAANERESRNYVFMDLSRNRSRVRSAAGTADKLFAHENYFVPLVIRNSRQSLISKSHKSISHKPDRMQEDTSD